MPIDPQAPVLLLGAGLTALDVALTLDQQGHSGPVYMLSRRGVQPLPHRASRHSSIVASDIVEQLLSSRPTVVSYLRKMRLLAAAAQQDDIDWRDIIGALRPVTTELWGRLPDKERQRFLRHAQIYWDAHRHRVAPASFATFAARIKERKLLPMAGRIRGIDVQPDGLRVQVGLRGSDAVESIEVSHIINCTGPNSNLALVDDQLIVQLRKAGLIQLDPFGLGICVDKSLAVRDSNGVPSTWLSYVGPMLKAQFWEATAVPELRVYAKTLAVRIAASLG